MNELTTLQSIERRIDFHIHGAYANILEVGRCLIEAKESGLVPHGQWVEWVKRTAGMSDRTAQRLMQAARDVSPDSAMARLPISKITAILALPEPQREAVAVKAVEENQTMRELQATIDDIRGDLEAARRDVKRVERERDNALEVNARISRSRQDYSHECDRLRKELAAAKAAPATGGTGSSGISAEAQAEIDRLSAALADAEQMAEYQASEREKAQQELLDMRTQAARGEQPGHDDLLAEAVGMAARTFMGAVGYIPHSDKLVTMRKSERDEIATYAAMLQRWSEDVLRVVSNARDAVVIEGV